MRSVPVVTFALVDSTSSHLRLYFSSSPSQLVFEMLHRLLHSEDRFQILRGLEILGSLATVESNEEILVNALGKDAFRRITDLLTGK